MKRLCGTKSIVVFFVAIVFLSSCSTKNSVSIRVKITSSKDSKVYIERLNFASSTIIDSSSVSKGDDNVRFRVKSVTEPTFLLVRVKDKGAITLLADPNEKIDLIINADKIYDYTVLGSKGSLKTKELDAKLSESKSKLYDLKMKYDATQNQVTRSLIEQEYNAVVDSQRAYSSRFIWANVMSRASVMALYQKFDDDFYVFDKSQDIALFKAVASSLKALYPNSNYTEGMLRDISGMENMVKAEKLKRMISQSISTIPEIALPNTKGEIIKLSSLKGKVVLLDFWASWDQNSLMDNRDLLDVYKQFKNKGFEIYQVSLDINRDDWANAIESAGLPWINVSELNPQGPMCAKVYNVIQIPTNYLIDRNHSIIGKNLFGEELRKKLREVL